MEEKIEELSVLVENDDEANFKKEIKGVNLVAVKEAGGINIIMYANEIGIISDSDIEFLFNQ